MAVNCPIPPNSRTISTSSLPAGMPMRHSMLFVSLKRRKVFRRAPQPEDGRSPHVPMRVAESGGRRQHSPAIFPLRDTVYARFMHGLHHSMIAQFNAHHLSSARIVAVLLLTLSGAFIAGCGGGNSKHNNCPIRTRRPLRPPSSSGTSVLTYHNDNGRTAQNLAETVLTPTNVASSTFGKVGFYAVDGKVDGEPLYVSGMSMPGKGTHNVLIAASEHDTVYAFDADTGSTLWSTTLLKSGETTSDARGCNQVEPEIGVTSTPVIDPKAGPNGVVYVVAMSKNGATYHQRLHALDLASGAELFNGPVEIQAKYPGTGENSDGTNVIFDPAQYKERVALLLLNGIIYTSWASHCDIQPYTGWIIAYTHRHWPKPVCSISHPTAMRARSGCQAVHSPPMTREIFIFSMAMEHSTRHSMRMDFPRKAIMGTRS